MIFGEFGGKLDIFIECLALNKLLCDIASIWMNDNNVDCWTWYYDDGNGDI